MSNPKQRPDATVKCLLPFRSFCGSGKGGNQHQGKQSFYFGEKIPELFSLPPSSLSIWWSESPRWHVGHARDPALASGKPPRFLPPVDHSGPWRSAANTHKELRTPVCNSTPSLMLISQQIIAPPPTTTLLPSSSKFRPDAIITKSLLKPDSSTPSLIWVI